MEQGSSKNPVPCANNCGFFGSPATGNLCSKCFRDSITEAAAAETAAVTTSRSSSSSSLLSAAEPGQVTATDAKEEEEGSGREGKRRCAACGRKVGLMGFECRCGGVFCGAHRYSDRHGCGYDYRAAGRDAIARANPVVRADKQLDKL